MSNLHKQLMSNRVPPVHPNPKRDSQSKSGRFGAPSYKPEIWNKYFDETKNLQLEKDNFRVYSKGSGSPVVLFLHGGGYSSLSWAVLCKDLVSDINCTCIAFDMRGHGDTHAVDEEDMSAKTLSNDVIRVLEGLFPEDCPPVILVGHSMGGAVAVHAANSGKLYSLVGLCVIDVVEGSALDALGSMQQVLRSRPQHFRSVDKAIEWCLRSGQVRNSEAARVAFPGQLKRTKTGETVVSELEKNCAVLEQDCSGGDKVVAAAAFREEDEEDVEAGDGHLPPPPVPPPASNTYTWRVDLSRTERFWTDWFKGMSQMFLGVSAAKLLLIAGTDRLDKDLTVGQMQGKFQMQMLPQCGHVIHEDQPEKVSQILGAYLVRNKFATPRGDIVPSMPAC